MSNKNFGFHTEADEVATYFENEIKGKTVLITGCTWGGLGAEAARVIAKHHAALVIVAGRKQESLDDTIQKIKAETPSASVRALIIDLASLESVKKAAADVNAYPEAIDVLINNAAIMASPYHTTKDGFEAQFGTNHIGPFLFTNLIMPKLLASKTGAPRIVNVSSIGHIFSPIRFDDPFFDNGKTYQKFWASYGQSKTANMLFARELAKRYKNKGLTAFSLHPGGIATNLGRDVNPEEFTKPLKDYDGQTVDWSNLEWKSIPEGTSTHLVADLIQISPQSLDLTWRTVKLPWIMLPYAKDDTQAEKLWQLSEKIIAQTLHQ
ncbi:short-chain dehydrogenase [Umbelopsis sp. PMI_123]|nr:short-chain dehydrogenase [Umbelopsis sp. PMI_123]